MSFFASLARPAARTTLAAALALSCAAVPVFLFGALSDRLRAELGFDAVGVGAGVTVFFVAAALGAYPAGRVTDRLGARTAVLAGAGAATVASVGIGALAAAWWQAAALLTVAGASVGLVDTGAARAFAVAVPTGRQGLAFGLKEASVPGASMLAGVTLPVLAVTVGWRPSFAVGLVLLPLVWVLLPRSAGVAGPATGAEAVGVEAVASAGSGCEPPGAAAGERQAGTAARPLGLLVLMAVAAGAGVGAANAAAAFLAPSATAAGLSPGAAGALLAVASIAAIAVRGAAGGMADRRPRREMGAVAGMLAVGAVGALALASEAASVTWPGALLVLGAGWGWTGLVFLAAVRADPDRPAASAGVVLAGLAGGGALGPLGFGVLISAAGYPAAWAATAAAMGAGVVLAAVAHRRLRRAGAPATGVTPPDTD